MKYVAERARDGSDGYTVKETGVGIVCYCFDTSGDDAKKIAKLLNAEQLELETREEYMDLPKASYQEVDQYMARAHAFLRVSSRGHRDVAALTATTLAEFIAFQEGKRLR